MKSDQNNLRYSQALRMLEETYQSFFLYGEAGSGKSSFIKKISNQSAKKIVRVAPTGIAALNIEGVTINSFFQFPFRPLIPEDSDIKLFPVNSKKRKIIQAMDTLIIDEISMVRADILDAIDFSLRINTRNRNLPFGGKQVVFVGDLYQLEPISKGAKNYKDIIQNLYGNNLNFFNALIFNDFELLVIKLNRVYRQNNKTFLDLLRRIRANHVMQDDIDNLNKNILGDSESHQNEISITLTTKNNFAQFVNETELSKLKGESYCYIAEIEGEFDKKYYPSEPKLILKKGAQVIFTKNDLEKRWVNGNIGIVSDLSDSYLEVKHENGSFYNVRRETWENIEYEYNEYGKKIVSKVVGYFTNYPVKLAWAITIHKSQGLTLDNVIIDFGEGTFASGQAYVALSRVKSMDKLNLKRQVKKEDFYFSKTILEFDKSLKHHHKWIELKVKEGKATFELHKTMSWERLGKYFIQKAIDYICIGVPSNAYYYLVTGYDYISCDCWASSFLNDKKVEIERFLKSSDFNCENYKIHLLKAVVFQYKQMHKEALIHIDKYLKINPDEDLGVYFKGVILGSINSKFNGEARSYFIKSLGLKKSSKSYYRLGRLKLDENSLINRFLAIKFNPSSSCAHWHFAELAMSEGLFSKSLKDYKGSFNENNSICGLNIGMAIENEIALNGLQSVNDYLEAIDKIMHTYWLNKNKKNKGSILQYINSIGHPERKSYEQYGGVYGLDDDTIDDAFEGDPDNYWNID